MEMDIGTLGPDGLLGQIQEALERDHGLKFAKGISRETVLQAALAILKGEDPIAKAPADGVITNSLDGLNSAELELMEPALVAHGGRYKEALVSVQRKLLAPYVDAGFTQVASSEKLTGRFPNLFG